VLVISGVVFVDTMFYAVIAPLLPTLTHELHLSKLSAGVMTASYPLGTLLGSVPGGILAARAGPRPTVMSGLALLAASTVAFALLHDAAALDAARAVEGIGGAFSWAGGIAWIAAETPPERRGALIGRTLAAAIGGALFGPVIGTLATAVGRTAAFGAVVILAALLIDACRRLGSAHVDARQGLGELRRALAKRGIGAGMWLVALPAIASGVMSVLAPLRLHHLGASAVAIGATFLLAAAAEAIVSPAVGALSDRRGRLLPLRLGLTATIALLVCFTLPRAVALLAALVIAVDAGLGVFWAPAMAMLSDAAEAHALDQGLAAALMNIAWAAGQALGSGVGGPLAGAVGDGLPTALAAALCLGTLAVLARRHTPRESAVI
jgi:MFS family permease